MIRRSLLALLPAVPFAKSPAQAAAPLPIPKPGPPDLRWRQIPFPQGQAGLPDGQWYELGRELAGVIYPCEIMVATPGKRTVMSPGPGYDVPPSHWRPWHGDAVEAPPPLG